jgi:hypothetical protein
VGHVSRRKKISKTVRKDFNTRERDGACQEKSIGDSSRVGVLRDNVTCTRDTTRHAVTFTAEHIAFYNRHG